MKLKYILLTALSAFALSSCGEKKTADNTENPPAATDSSLQSMVLTSAPSGAKQVSEIRQSAKEGDQVVVSGKIIGGATPFVAGRAMMILGDPTKLTSCDLHEGDQCTTPWDVCCDDPDVIKQSIVTVQVLDEEGKPLKEGLKGLGGMKELSKLVVTGVVADGSTADNMLINATGFYIQD
ncbi:hypothetical protein JIN77_08830 [Verrucomicrobiaceae bacterium R5-34]|uniref:Uncharacterized protein n=1 Tax=Oceaniferula flava TaxID=2800421 RepID=A0AAE2VD86_9BACT|nr:hypothetical protein [Oceaniferula flavus]MBK1830827.1 hypothetical protein [Verrucomicrobiaceae bacterium R5-34]MBK1856470.1 hypothetical protein [Oceaniferula flavus]MBM1137777.1 hypothetical protein [Oceaniferula flavus]